LAIGNIQIENAGRWQATPNPHAVHSKVAESVAHTGMNFYETLNILLQNILKNTLCP
jgi:hypothetical protein